jgi:uncharacterized protein YfaS (alpha-2-macroglobulin family)
MLATADASDTSPATLSTTVNVTTIVHDVAVTSVTVPSSVTQGQSATVSVSVKNNGTATESILVSLTSNPANAAGNPASRTISLNAGQSTSVSFSWATTTSTGTGSYTLTGHASISPETDAAPSDNDRMGSNQISVVAPTSSGGFGGWGGWGGWFFR